jgi:hypothetical protein
MLQFVGAYLAVAGGVQVARGAVRGAGRLAKGDGRGALVEVAGGLAAPVVSAAHQLSRLGSEVCQSATTLTAEARHKLVNGRSTEPRGPARRRRSSAAKSNASGAAAEGAAAGKAMPAVER